MIVKLYLVETDCKSKLYQQVNRHQNVCLFLTLTKGMSETRLC